MMATTQTAPDHRRRLNDLLHGRGGPPRVSRGPSPGIRLAILVAVAANGAT